MNTKFITSPDSFRIAYDVSGSGPAILLLHGGSDKPTDPSAYSTQKMGQDVLAVADACGVERFILLGYSFGRNVSRYLAARSRRISRLVMLGNRMGTSLSNEFRQSILEFRTRWKPVEETAGTVFAPKSLPVMNEPVFNGR